MAAVKTGTSGCAFVNLSTPSGAASRQTKRRLLAPRSFSLSMAAMAELAVASIGSTTMTSRSARFCGRLEVIFDRLQRLVVAVEADMGDAGRRHEIEHAFEQAVAGAQDRGEDQLLAFQNGRLHLRQRRLDRLHRQSSSRVTS